MANTCREAIEEVFAEASGVLETSQVIDRIYARYPHRPWKLNTISAHLVGLSVNHPSSIHHSHCRRYGFLFSLGNSRYRKWNPIQDGIWKVINGRVQRVDSNAKLEVGDKTEGSNPHGREQTSTEPPRNQQKGSRTAKDISPEVTLDDLTLWRRGLIRLLDKIDGGPRKEGVVFRIKRLSRLGRIPREIAPFMIAIAEMRNVSEYENKRLSHAEGEAIRHAWTAVVEWARAEGIELKP